MFSMFAGLLQRKHQRKSKLIRMKLIKARYEMRFEANEVIRARSHKEAVFDASMIIEKYENYEFGSQEVNEIHLCCLASQDSDKDYKTIAFIQF